MVYTQLMFGLADVTPTSRVMCIVWIARRGEPTLDQVPTTHESLREPAISAHGQRRWQYIGCFAAAREGKEVVPAWALDLGVRMRDPLAADLDRPVAQRPPHRRCGIGQRHLNRASDVPGGRNMSAVPLQ